MGAPQQNRRDDLRAADDVQAVETRRRLVAAYRDAADELRTRPSVTWICERSGVARSTFYTHFATVDDLAVFVVTEAFGTFSAFDVERRTAHDLDRRAITRVGLTHVLDAFEQTRDVLDYAIRVGSRAAVLERLVTQFVTFTRATVAAEYDDLDEAGVDLLTEFVSAGTVHTILRWMDHATTDREHLVDQLVDALPARLTSPA